MTNPAAKELTCKNEDALFADIVKGSLSVIELARAHFAHAAPGASLRALARWYEQGGAETLALLRRLQSDQAEIVATRARIAAIERLVDLARTESNDKKEDRQACADLLKSCTPRSPNNKARQAQTPHPSSDVPHPIPDPRSLTPISELTDDQVRELLATAPMHPIDSDDGDDP